MRTRTFLILSLLLNLLLAGAIAFMLHRLGGWNYALFRFQNGEEGLYFNRKNQFESLATQPNAVVFLGDSQTEQGEWEELLGDTLHILNRGISGDHVNGILERLDDVLRNKPSKIFLCIGLNDLFFDKPTLEIERTYREIVQKIRQNNPSGQLFLESILPVNNTVQRVGISNEQIQELNLKIKQIAKDYALPYIDVYEQLTDASGNLSEKYTKDGVHLNGQGYLVWKKMIEKHLSK